MEDRTRLNAGMVVRERRNPTKAPVDLSRSSGVSMVYRQKADAVIAEARRDLNYHRVVDLDIHDPCSELEPWQRRRRFT